MHHGQNGDALSAFKKTSPLKETVSGKKQGELSPLKSGSRTTRGLVKKHRSRGTGQPARSLQRIKEPNLSGYSGRSARPGGAALVLPRCDTCGMQGHPEDRSSQVEPGAHALIIPDQAGGHTTTNLDSPDNITLLPLPPRNPIRSKTSGNICDKTGCQTASLTIRTRSFPSVVTHGTTSPTGHGKSCQSDIENGRMGSDFPEMV